MKLEIQIMQQEATVKLLTSYVATKRGNQSDLDDAKRRLDELMELRAPSMSAPPTKKVVSVFEPIKKKAKVFQAVASFVPLVPSASTKTLRKELWDQIDKKKRELAEVCNSMHSVPESADCPELMMDALNLKAEEEQLWTKFRYLEKNGKLPLEEAPEQKQASLELLSALDKRKKLGEKRSKLKKKLEDPRNKKHRLCDKWTTELDYANLELDRLDDDIYLLKNR